MARLGIGMINMYVEMVNEAFGPLMREINARNTDLKETAKIEARKKLGIYDMYVKRTKLQAQIDEINSKVNRYESRNYNSKKDKWECAVDDLADDILKRHTNGIERKIREAHHDAVNSIKLSGLAGDVAKLFDELPDVIKKLSKEIEAAPMPKLIKN